MSSTKKYNSRLGDSKRGVEAGIAVEKADADSGQIDQGEKKRDKKVQCVVLYTQGRRLFDVKF